MVPALCNYARTNSARHSRGHWTRRRTEGGRFTTRSPPICLTVCHHSRHCLWSQPTIKRLTTSAFVPLPPVLNSATTWAALANNALNLDDAGQPLTYASSKAGHNAQKWNIAEAEELDRLLSTDTIRPLTTSEQPLGRRRDTTYYNPQTKEKQTASGERTFRIRGTIGGDRVNYPRPTTARTAAMPLVKMLIHSVISDNAHWLTIDIKDFYLNTPLPRPEYLRI